jgi:hypothetical protein
MRHRLAFAGIVLFFASTSADACSLCMGMGAHSAAQELAEVPRAVLAAPEGERYRVIEVIKGERPEDMLSDVTIRDPDDAGKVVLLVRDETWPMWLSLGAADAGDATTLRNLAVTPPAQTDTAAWEQRVNLVLPYLAGPQPMLADMAYSECTSAPYAALRTAKLRIDADALRRSLDDPEISSRHPLYVLLLGIAGDARDADTIEAQLDAASRAHDATNLASLLAADLELRGPSRVAWIEDRYLRDTSRTSTELQVALLALSVQGDTRGAIPRERIIDAYLLFMRERKDMAGLVAQDLAKWQYWEAVSEFTTLLQSNVRQQYASRAAIVEYLRQSPAAKKSD